jgi:hypothetical protein
MDGMLYLCYIYLFMSDIVLRVWVAWAMFKISFGKFLLTLWRKLFRILTTGNSFDPIGKKKSNSSTTDESKGNDDELVTATDTQETIRVRTEQCPRGDRQTSNGSQAQLSAFLPQYPLWVPPIIIISTSYARAPFSCWYSLGSFRSSTVTQHGGKGRPAPGTGLEKVDSSLTKKKIKIDT